MKSGDFSLESGEFAFEGVHVLGQEVDLGIALGNGLLQLGDVRLGDGVLAGLILVSEHWEKRRKRGKKGGFRNVFSCNVCMCVMV